MKTGTDLLFVIDSSTSLSEDQWRMQIGFVRNFIEAQKIGDQDDEMRVAFVFFSSERHIYSYDWKSQLIRGELISEVFGVPHTQRYSQTIQPKLRLRTK